MEETVKHSSCWPVHFELQRGSVRVGRWTSERWTIVDLCFPREGGCERGYPYVLPVQLFKDERTDYRFNLSSRAPKLFLVFAATTTDHAETALASTEERLVPVKATVSQAVAASYMDGEFLVLSEPLPMPVQAWMEAYMGRHGELLETRQKKRQGAGRASGN